MHSQFKNQRGQGLIEYLIIVALIAVAGISVVGLMGSNLRVQFSRITRTIQGESMDGVEFHQVRKSHHQKRDMGDFFKGSAIRESQGE